MVSKLTNTRFYAILLLGFCRKSYELIEFKKKRYHEYMQQNPKDSQNFST